MSNFREICLYLAKVCILNNYSIPNTRNILLSKTSRTMFQNFKTISVFILQYTRTETLD